MTKFGDTYQYQFYTEIILHDELENSIVSDACKRYPKESCGLIIGERYFSIPNIAKNPESTFQFDLYKFTQLVNEFGFSLIRAICHSHPEQINPLPSEQDKILKQNYGFNLVICGVCIDETV